MDDDDFDAMDAEEVASLADDMADLRSAEKRIAELEAERDSLIAANVVLREAMKDIHDTTFNQSLQSLINMALTQPVTTEALERVRREAQVKIERLKRDWRGYYDELPPPPEGV